MKWTFVVDVVIEADPVSDESALAAACQISDWIGLGLAARLRAQHPDLPALIGVRPVTEIPPAHEDPKTERPAL
ncbi:MAG: hypothetical protein ACKVYV_14250 [Limisphaerales bacterium]